MSETAAGAPDAAPPLDALPLGILSFDDDGAVVVANGALHEMLAYPPGALIGMPVERVLTVSGRIFLQTHLLPLVRMAGRAEELFILLRAADGSDVGALVNVSRGERDGRALFDFALMRVRERRKFEDALLLARHDAEAARAEAEARGRELRDANDLMEKQAVELELQAEELQTMNDELIERAHELEEARDEADRANRAKSDFLAVMSHELRTPLNAIGGYAELIELGIHGPVTTEQRTALDGIQRSQRALLAMIGEVLNYARLETGAVEYDITEVRVADAVGSAEMLVAPQLRAKGLTFTWGGCDSRLAVRADRDKLQQVLLNLLSNAIKFTEPRDGNAGTIELTCAPDSSMADRVVVRVRDSGIGIPADKLAAVFEPFVQVNQGLTRPQQGTGLGLAISRDLVRGMGGELTLESTPGTGSTFTVTLPRA